jgi:nickel-dependent lactate racemase
MTYLEKITVGSSSISAEELRASVREALDALGARRRVLAVPPDITRRHSCAGTITELVWEYYEDRLTDILPALGTHAAMTEDELSLMFGRVPHSLFRVHRWKEDVETIGRVPADYVRELSEGRLDYDWPAQMNRLILDGGHDLVLCIGQVVPHEVVGMAGQSKMLFVGAGGSEAINKSHYLGAVYGMERIMGRARSPVRDLFDYASEHFATGLPVVYILTVVGSGADGESALKGIFVGDDTATFARAAALSLEVNFTMFEKSLDKVVAYLDPGTFKSTWIGNKAIYRTRMAIADGGELVILAPGVRQFGEDADIDRVIRKYGYFATPEILDLVRKNGDLRENLSAAAHLIHGSSEGRFAITYCPGGLDRAEIERANFRYGDTATMMRRYDPRKLRYGWNELPDGERIYYIPNPATGLWAERARFERGDSAAPARADAWAR